MTVTWRCLSRTSQKRKRNRRIVFLGERAHSIGLDHVFEGLHCNLYRSEASLQYILAFDSLKVLAFDKYSRLIVQGRLTS